MAPGAETALLRERIRELQDLIEDYAKRLTLIGAADLGEMLLEDLQKILPARSVYRTERTSSLDSPDEPGVQ